MNDPATPIFPDAPLPPLPRRWRDRDAPVACLLVAWVAVVFGLVWNPWWMPSGDAEVFVSIARNLLLGRGFSFNGGPVAFVTPGWPLALSGWLRLTDQYLWLKLVQIVQMTLFLLTAYATLRRFVRPATAGLACGMSAILWPLYPLTMWLHSDALFCAVAGVAGLIAVNWGDRRLGRWWLLAIVVGAGLGVFIRWAALAYAIVLAALICGSGREMTGRSPWWPNLARRHWIGALAALAGAIGTFAILKGTLHTGEAAPSHAAARQTGLLTLAFAPASEEMQTPGLFNRSADPFVTPLQELASRVLSVPQWFSWTLFSPLRVAGGFPGGVWLDRAVGLLAMATLGVAAWHGSRRRGQHLWLGVLVYVTALGIDWPHPNNRYVVPVAPFLIAGILTGLAHLVARPRWRAAARALRWSFVAATLAVNGALWSVDVLICRTRTAEDFYARWEAGIYVPLIDVGAYLDARAVADPRIVASPRYHNLNERWEYKLSQRAVILMTGREVGLVPKKFTGSGVRKMQAWARETGVTFYVHQNPTVPGRFWHFRVPAWLEKEITGYDPPRERPQYELFEMKPEPVEENPHLRSLLYVPVPPLMGAALESFTRRVPHMNHQRGEN